MRKILCLETGEIFNSIAEAARVKMISERRIYRVCQGERKKTGGLHWQYLENIKINKKSGIRRRIPVYCVELEKTFDSISSASRELGISDSWITNVCKNRYKTAGGYHWVYDEEAQRFKNENGRALCAKDFGKKKHYLEKVYCIELRKVFNSIKEAAKGVNMHYNSINGALRSKSKSAGGYHWVWLKDAEKFKEENGREMNSEDFQEYKYNGTAIYCIELKKTFRFIKDAAKELNLSATCIGQTCKKRQKSHGGYHWVYLKEAKEFEKKNGRAIELSDLENKKNSKKILCVETGEIFCSSKEAAEKLKTRLPYINLALRDNARTANGYHWVRYDNAQRFEKENGRPISVYDLKKNKKCLEVFCFELNKTFSSISNAGKMLGVSISSISSACKGNLKTAGKYHWAYMKDMKIFEKENGRPMEIKDLKKSLL